MGEDQASSWMVAIYTDVGNAFHVISKITLRIKG